MDCSLAPYPSLRATGPDLRAELERQRKSQRDLAVAGSDLRLVDIAGEAVVRVGDEMLPLAPAAAAALAALVPVASATALLAQRHDVDAWFASQDGVRLRVLGHLIVAVMPAGWRVVDDGELLGTVVDALAGTGVDVSVDHCRLRHGEWMLSLVAPGLKGEVGAGDYFYGGLHLTTSPARDTDICTRIYRLLCRNGALADMTEARRFVMPRMVPHGGIDPYTQWSDRVASVVAVSFRGVSVDEDAQRLRRLLAELLTNPYEHLCHLRAQGLITAEEQVSIQREFNRAHDQSMYGLVNAITSIAHGHRSRDEWQRAMAMERLGGEVMRGDHMPPTWAPAFSR